jgi:hypothetical protein
MDAGGFIEEPKKSWHTCAMWYMKSPAWMRLKLWLQSVFYDKSRMKTNATTEAQNIREVANRCQGALSNRPIHRSRRRIWHVWSVSKKLRCKIWTAIKLLCDLRSLLSESRYVYVLLYLVCGVVAAKICFAGLIMDSCITYSLGQMARRECK